MTKRTHISDVIVRLEEIRDEHGDVPVMIGGPPGDYVSVEVKTVFPETMDETRVTIGLTHDEEERLPQSTEEQ